MTEIRMRQARACAAKTDHLPHFMTEKYACPGYGAAQYYLTQCSEKAAHQMHMESHDTWCMGGAVEPTTVQCGYTVPHVRHGHVGIVSDRYLIRECLGVSYPEVVYEGEAETQYGLVYPDGTVEFLQDCNEEDATEVLKMQRTPGYSLVQRIVSPWEPVPARTERRGF